MLREYYVLFVVLVLSNSWILRSGIVDAYQYKMTNRERRNYGKGHSFWFHILLPWREMKDCHAPWHMQLFQLMRRVNIAMLIVVGLIYRFGAESFSMVLTCYGIMVGYGVLYLLPFCLYGFYLSNAPGNPKGWNFDKAKRK